jgi:SEC-C motif domain protein
MIHSAPLPREQCCWFKMAIFLWITAILLCEAPLARSFAAKKGRQSSKTVGSLHRGFGKAPPTLEETVVSFKTRKPPPPCDDLPCPCGQYSYRSYGECCGPYHNGEMEPMEPFDVLRTRYSAFCLRIVEYIIRTTHPTNRDYADNKVAWAKELDRNGMFDSYDFVSLTVLKEQELTSEDEGFVEFEVTLRANKANKAIEGQTSVIKERSRFLCDRETKVWSYAGGEISTRISAVDDAMIG